jgi:glycosyltransferase involved in cell wall biosynthesis
MRAALGFNDGDFVALFAARLRREKRVGVFVDAVNTANGFTPHIRGLVAGHGPEFELALTRAQASTVVTVLGERTDVPDLMVASDVVCLTSDAEALPMVIIEAMALGKPVIATNVGGVSDVVVDGVTGFVTDVDQGQTLSRILCDLADNVTLAQAMGIAGRRRYEERFTLELMADRYATLLRELSGAHSTKCGSGSRGELSNHS